MRTTQQLSITLPLDMAEMVRAKVSAELYASESEVIRDGLRVLLARDQVVEDWLRGDVAAAFDRTAADPDRVVPVDEVRARVARRAGKGTDSAGR